MTQWTAFVGFTALVLSGFLVLARLSQHVVDAEDGTGTGAQTRTRTRTRTRGGGSSQNERTDTRQPTDDRPVDEDPTVDETRTVEEAVRTPASGRPGREDESRTEQSLVADPATPDGPVTPTSEFAHPDSPAEASMSPGALLANVALTQGLFGGLLAAAAWYFGIPGSALGLWGGRVEGVTAIAVGLGFGVVLWVGNEIATGVADEVGAAYDEGLRSMLAPDDARGWLLLLGVTLPIIAVVEEFLFRAAAIGAPSAAFGGAWALAVVSSIAFALGHGAQGRVGIVVTGALGFALAGGFILTGSFLAVVVAHYLVNALEFVVHEGFGVPDPIWSE